MSQVQSEVLLRREVKVAGLVSLNEELLKSNFEVLIKYLEELNLRLKKNELAQQKLKDDFDFLRKKNEKDLAEVKRGGGFQLSAEGLEDSAPVRAIKQHLSLDFRKNMLQPELRRIQESENKLSSSIEAQLRKGLEDSEDRVRHFIETAQNQQFGEMSRLREIINSGLATIPKEQPETQQVLDRLNEVEESLGIVFERSKMALAAAAQISELKEGVDKRLEELSLGLRKKADNYDLVKLEEMLLGAVQLGTNQALRRSADKEETKKALVFLEKRINKLVLLSQVEDAKDPLITSKNIKCVSCAGDLGIYEGNLDKYRPWAVFPAKELQPEKMGGSQHFGQGFQAKIEKLVEKKGATATFSKEGHMTKPFDLSRGTRTPVYKARPKPKQASTTETCVMSSYGRKSDLGMHLQQSYEKKFGGVKTLHREWSEPKKQ